MSNNGKKTDDQSQILNPMYHENHAKPVSRRELLGQGFLGMSASVMMPSLLSMIEGRAYGAEELVCSAPAAATRNVPFLIFDLAGGGNIPGSGVMVGKRNGQKDFLTTYTSLGLPDGMHPKNAGQLNEEFGLAFHNDSGFLRGLQSTTTPDIRARIDGAIFCTSSNDDTQNNPHNPAYLIAKAGARGDLVTLLGSTTSPSGGNSIAPADSINPAIRPVQVARPADVLGLVNPGKLATLLTPDDVKKILAATRKMSKAKLAMFQNKDLPNQLKDLVECGYVQSSDLMTKFTPARVDPSQDADVNAVFTALATNAEQARVGSIAAMVIQGYAGAGTISRGGYDYHNGSRATGETKQFEVGALIGQAISLAARKKSDLMIYVYTDGGVVSNGTLDNSAGGRGKGVWTADSGQRSATFTIVYKHSDAAVRPEIRNGLRQIGAFRDTGGVDEEASKIGASVDLCAKAVVANYLALHGKEGMLAQVLGSDPFGADLDKILAFAKIR